MDIGLKLGLVIVWFIAPYLRKRFMKVGMGINGMIDGGIGRNRCLGIYFCFIGN